MKKILSVLLVVLMLVGMVPATVFGASAAETTTVEFAVYANKGTTGTKTISWTSDGVTFTNNQGSSSTAIRTSDSDHYRVYQNSEVVISAPGNITQIVITSTESKYNTPWINSAKAIGTATNSGNVITVVPTTPATSLSFDATAQARLKKISVTYEVASTEPSCEHTNTTTTTVDASCGKEGSITVTCDDCGETISTEVIPALEHEYVNGTCTNCGNKMLVVSFSVSAGQTAPDDQTCDANNQTTLPNMENPEGYTFVGWAESEVAETTTKPTIYPAGEKYTASNNCTLYAVYSYETEGEGGGSGAATEYKLFSGALTEGDYVIVYDKGAMNTTVSSGRLGYTSVTISNDTISSPEADIIWHIAPNGDYWTIYNGASSVYAASTGVKNKATTITSVTDNAQWSVSGTSTYEFVNKANAANSVNANLRRNGTYGFACYATGTGGALSLYKAVTSSVTTYYTSTVSGTTTECEHTNTTETTVNASCESAGSVTVTCDDCGAVLSETEIPATGHKMGEGVVVDPTCEEDGSKTFTCTVCGEEQVETIDKLGHDWDAGTQTKVPTCEEAGEMSYTCQNDPSHTKTEEIAALGHDWDDGTQTKAPTCEEAGEMSYVCQNDPSHTKTEEIAALGHSYNENGVCTNCGAEVTKFQLVTDYKEILAGGDFVLAVKHGDQFYAIDNAAFGSDMDSVLVTVNGTGADSWVQWAESVPVWKIDYYTNRQNSFSISYGNQYLTYGGSGTGFGTPSAEPYAWTFVNKDAQGNNEYDADYAVTDADGIVSFYTADADNTSRSINYVEGTSKFRVYSNNNNFDTVCFFKAVKAAGENCTVKFMENGTETMTQTVENGEFINLPEPTLDSYPEGYTSFVGWVTLPYMETLIAPDTIYYVSESAGDQNTTLQVTADMTLYALYSRTDPDAEGQSMSYYQVTDESEIAAGEYYIIVGYDEANDKWFAMSLDQYNDARGGSWVTPDENGVIKVVPNDRVASFRLEYGYNTGTYGFFDVMRNQFLSSTAATEENNSLRSAATLGETESFQIAINDDGSYSIISQEKDSVVYLVLYNTNDNKNPLFSCYDVGTGIDKTKTYLYVGRTNAEPGTYYATGTCAHNWELTKHVDASCTTAGYTQYTCSICGEVKMEDVVAHGHQLGEAIIENPTCTEAGSSTSVCTACGETWKETIPATGHTPDGITAHDKDADHENPYLSFTCSVCGAFIEEKELRFNGGFLTLENDLRINYSVDASLFEEGCYTAPYVIFTLGNRVGENQLKVTDYSVRDGRYIFTCHKITPSQIGDTVFATLYASFEGTEYSAAVKTYGVSTYCYNMLEKSDDADLKRLLVDILNYGAAARAYTGYVPPLEQDQPMPNAKLTDEQKALATPDDVLQDLEYITNTKYEELAGATARWTAASLRLQETVVLRARFAVDDVTGVTAKMLIDGSEVEAIRIEPDPNKPGQYFAYFNQIKGSLLWNELYMVVYRDGVPISNTLRYSVGSYAVSKMNDPDVTLSDLVKAIMKYGYSAKAFLR